jgi:predicted NAD/FAD-dependent oxidoreductase
LIILKAIIGASIGGCATAYFLEQLLKQDETCANELEIDIYEKEDEIGGRKPSKVNHRGNCYDLKTTFVDFTQNYMTHFAQLAG